MDLRRIPAMLDIQLFSFQSHSSGTYSAQKSSSSSVAQTGLPRFRFVPTTSTKTSPVVDATDGFSSAKARCLIIGFGFLSHRPARRHRRVVCRFAAGQLYKFSAQQRLPLSDADDTGSFQAAADRLIPDKVAVWRWFSSWAGSGLPIRLSHFYTDGNDDRVDDDNDNIRFAE